MAALICIKRVRGTFCQLVNIANRFLRIFFNIEASIIFIFPGGAGYPYLPTRLIGINIHCSNNLTKSLLYYMTLLDKIFSEIY